MKKVLLLSSLLALGAVASYAAPAACKAGDTLANYITLGSTGCENGDKVFSNFAYAPTGGDPASSGVTIGLDNQPGIFLFGLQFGSSTTTIWTSGFTLSYTITVDQAQCFVLYGSGACQIIEAQGAMQGATTPNTAALSMALSPGATLNLDALDTTHEVKQAFFGGITSTNVVITGSGLTTSTPISSFGLDVYQQAVPEPISLSLTGLGLLGLGIFGRRKLKQ